MTSFATCRRATVDDLDAIDTLARDLCTLHHAAWPTLFTDAGSAGRDHPHWHASIVGDGHAAFVAERDGVAVGFVTVSVAQEAVSLRQPTRFATVHSICVADAVRGSGAGRALMARAEEWALAQGAVDLRLSVYDFNGRARRLYEDLGFVARSTSMGKPLPVVMPDPSEQGTVA